jgi:hypothetical protein
MPAKRLTPILNVSKHVRHPDGHVFRIGHGLHEDDDTPNPDKVDV